MSKEMIFACKCAKCGAKESTGVSHFSDGRELCKKCSEAYDSFILDLFLRKTDSRSGIGGTK